MQSPRLAAAALVGVLLTLGAPGPTLAAESPIRLALTPVGQAGPFFDLVMEPGETRTLAVDIGNMNDSAIAVRTYAADVYTIINGGFGGRLRGEPQSGMTRWLDYPTRVIGLPAGDALRRSFTVTVPKSATPGEYIASLVLENDQPVVGGGPVALAQIIRQAVAVVVTVPGRRAPAVAIGEATYMLAAQGPIVSVAVQNAGNIRLKPLVTFSLSDATGTQVDQASVPMDTFYARTATTIEVPLAAPLAPGTYTIRLTVVDATQGAEADRPDIRLVVTAPPAPAPSAGTGFGVTEMMQGLADGRMTPLAWIILVVGWLGVLILIALSVRFVRRTARTDSEDR